MNIRETRIPSILFYCGVLLLMIGFVGGVFAYGVANGDDVEATVVYTPSGDNGTADNVIRSDELDTNQQNILARAIQRGNATGSIDDVTTPYNTVTHTESLATDDDEFRQTVQSQWYVSQGVTVVPEPQTTFIVQDGIGSDYYTFRVTTVTHTGKHFDLLNRTKDILILGGIAGFLIALVGATLRKPE